MKITKTLVLAALILFPLIAGASQNPAQVPFVMKVDGPQEVKAGSEIEIKATVTRNTLSDLPMELKVTLPDGAVLIDGKTSETITDPVSTKIERTWLVTFEAVPAKDVEVELVVRNGDLSARSTGAYRFGRPEPRLNVPATGKAVHINDQPQLKPVLIETK
jgi:hypothetical protein